MNGVGLWARAVATPFGELVIVWRQERLHEGHYRALLRRIYLPCDGASPLPRARADYAGLRLGEHPVIASLAAALNRYLHGEAVALNLALADLAQCPEFQQRVLLAEHAVPRGCVTTYGRLAAHLDAPRAARAVGAALARNPYPLLIPCHRALRSDLSLGGYQGGLAMKRALLELEGHTFCAGRVQAPAAMVWY
jgi:methylated-DNA-[protein]-cysteine S-methyltransferase